MDTHAPLPDRPLADVLVELGLDRETSKRIGVLWGKSRRHGGGYINLLVSHLLDTAAVAEQLWECFLPVQTRHLLDRVSGSRGRPFFMWLCAVHDCGKATPAFQAVDEEGAAQVRAAGLEWRDSRLQRRRWRHDKAGGRLLHSVLESRWDEQNIAWVWPLIAGHHGAFPSKVTVLKKYEARDEHQGTYREPWKAVQWALIEIITRALGYTSLEAVEPKGVLTKAEQLTISGLIIMADWIASDSDHFEGVEDIAQVSLRRSRERAAKAIRELRLRGGWGALDEPTAQDLVKLRFDDESRPFQKELVEAVRHMTHPGLVTVEAPMGEGKTKGALAAAEVLAARFGCDGVFVGMPTQATSDPIYSQVLTWVSEFDEALKSQVALLHGKKMFHPEWRELWHAEDGSPDTRFAGVDCDDFGMDDIFAVGGQQTGERSGPARWFLGRNRGLLTAFAVGTIDQLLYAATRTRHVMLRFAGLAGKVVILDEVHAADVYMSQFLTEALRWLGQARVPVILLSATLPPAQRSSLTDAYLHGALGATGSSGTALPAPAGYPSVTVAYPEQGEALCVTRSAESWRSSQPVSLEWLPDTSDQGLPVASRVREEMADGGVALVILNQVDRAQNVYRELKDAYPGQVHLLHGRLCAAHRADRASLCVTALGPKADRPERMIVVATQVAEQSFDVDADLLVTDLAPVDLLLQRIGRLHRHEGVFRPAHLRTPRVLVTGVNPDTRPHPTMLKTSEHIYGRYMLLRTLALVNEAGDKGWSIPEQVPDLVARGYGEELLCEPSLQEDELDARSEWQAKERNRAAEAEGFLLSRPDHRSKPTLEGLHHIGTTASEERDLQALVRDGSPSVEVIIVRRAPRGLTTVDGEWVGVQGEASEQVREAVLGGLTRLPSRLAEAAEELIPLEGWRDDPWLRFFPALVLDEDGWAPLGSERVGYDQGLGLLVQRTN
ncbi:CRISPR-associated helicase Cas3' [Nocardiopsis sp. NPDC050513]|uniref:CRISPR-associated helicase Cas3' n=1 Tax=Nocardiopsis sp. NPDC050513 TaxID=3364338 RepID=UPI0037B4CB16